MRFEELKKQSHADIMNVLDRDVIFTVNTPGRVAIPSIFTFWEQGQRRTGAYNFLSRRRLVQLICSVTARKLSLFLASEKIEYIVSDAASMWYLFAFSPVPLPSYLLLFSRVRQLLSQERVH